MVSVVTSSRRVCAPVWIPTPGFRRFCGFCSPGSTSALDTVLLLGWHLGFTSVSFCLFVFVVGLPPRSTFSGLGWSPHPLLGVAHQGLSSFFGSFILWLGLFFGSPASFFFRPSGLLGFFFLFLLCFSTFLLFRLWLCALFVAPLVCMFLIWP